MTTSEILTKFTFYAPDGSNLSATTAGLANDYADRSAAQAQSVAFRVALLQTFALPTHSLEPEQTGVEREAPAPAVPEEAKLNPVKELQAQIKAAAGAADVKYLDYIRALFPDKTAGDLTAADLKKVLKAIVDGEAV